MRGWQPVDSDRYIEWMTLALAEAKIAAAKGEVPVGAIMVHADGVIARAHNLRETEHDPLAHAELLVIRESARLLSRWRLSECTLVCTLEPCPMCAGAIVNARVDTVVFGATDLKTGACGSLMNIVADPRLNHHPTVHAGILAEESAALLRQFFEARR